METNERLKTAYNYLVYNKLITNQKNLAEIMKTSPPCISYAMNGNGKYLTNKFLHRFNQAFDNIFNISWLITGKGEMLRSSTDTTDTIYNKESSPGSIQIATSNHKGDNIIASGGDAEKQQNNMQQGTEKSYDTFLQGLVERLMSTNEKLTATNEKLTDELSSIRSMLEQQSAKMREMESALGCPDAHSPSTSTEQNVGMKGVG